MLLNIFRKVYVALLYLLGVISVLFDVFRIVLVALFKKKKDVEVEDSTPRILGTGRADGTYRYRQDFLANKLVEQYPHLSEQEHQTIREVFRKTGTESCTSCWPEELLFKNVGRKEWQKHVVKAHLQMGGEAMEKVRKEVFCIIAPSTAGSCPIVVFLLLTAFFVLSLLYLF